MYPKSTELKKKIKPESPSIKWDIILKMGEGTL